MGGDLGLRAALPAALTTLARFPTLQLDLLGDEPALRAAAGRAGAHARRLMGERRLQLHGAEQVVAMTDKPSAALRHKRRSSMWLALEMLAAGEVDAVVSAGNTGALMAMSLALLERLPHVDRPAFCARLPTRTGYSHLLDLGANVDSRPEHLVQFGLMGAALAAVGDGPSAPSVALLNVGSEPGKGNEQVRQADRLFRASEGLRYVGFIEADGLFRGDADVVVADGFAGNVLLKASEGTAELIRDKLRAHFKRPLARVGAAMLAPLLAPLYRELDPQRYSGAMLLGMRGVVVKSHGNSGELALVHALGYALAAVSAGLLDAVEDRMTSVSRIFP